MRSKKAGMAGAAVLMALLVAPPSGAQEVQRLSGTEVSVYNLAGTTRVVRGSGSDVVVRLTRGGSDASRLSVQTGMVGGRQTLRVIYPGDQVVYPEMGRGSRTNVRVRGDGTFWGRSESRGDQVEVRWVDGPDRPTLLEAVADADALRVRSATTVDAEVIAAATRSRSAVPGVVWRPGRTWSSRSPRARTCP